MIISRKSHDLIVAEQKKAYELLVGELRDRIAELQADHVSRQAHDLIVAELRTQIEKLEKSQNFYRKEWTKTRGKAFPEPSMPLFDQPLTEAPFDAGWTPDDHMLFRKWSLEQGEGVKPDEEWKRLYGSQPPLIVLTV